jgi:hypothetical protein
LTGQRQFSSHESHSINIDFPVATIYLGLLLTGLLSSLSLSTNVQSNCACANTARIATQSSHFAGKLQWTILKKVGKCFALVDSSINVELRLQYLYQGLKQEASHVKHV